MYRTYIPQMCRERPNAMTIDLSKLFDDTYQLKKLKVDRGVFLSQLQKYTQDQGPWMTIKTDFTETRRWGHNHNFGEGVNINGTMENRHLRIMNRFLQRGLPENLHGKKVLVIGCYTGGDALLLAALGAEVHAIEEVPYYAEIANWLSSSFAANLTVKNASIDRESIRSVYEKEDFDFVYNSGVMYHLRNIIGGIENCYHFLKPGGLMFLETMITEDIKGRKILEYHGPSRTGYNWYLPNIEAVESICNDIGFQTTFFHTEPNARASFVCSKQG
jgi:2-polyprenyl-3-methyl-5-hydroxy-6-metoxy-1,4-benzoquinol methylase